MFALAVILLALPLALLAEEAPGPFWLAVLGLCLLIA